MGVGWLVGSMSGEPSPSHFNREAGRVINVDLDHFRVAGPGVLHNLPSARVEIVEVGSVAEVEAGQAAGSVRRLLGRTGAFEAGRGRSRPPTGKWGGAGIGSQDGELCAGSAGVWDGTLIVMARGSRGPIVPPTDAIISV